MRKEQIEAAIRERLEQRWKQRCIQELAAPVCVIAIKQMPGPNFGVPVVCTMEDMPNHDLAELLFGLYMELREMG
jgi:hypothetical protein